MIVKSVGRECDINYTLARILRQDQLDLRPNQSVLKIKQVRFWRKWLIRESKGWVQDLGNFLTALFYETKKKITRILCHYSYLSISLLTDVIDLVRKLFHKLRSYRKKQWKVQSWILCELYISNLIIKFSRLTFFFCWYYREIETYAINQHLL